MSTLAQTPTSTTSPSTRDVQRTTPGSGSMAGSGGHSNQIQRLTPRESLPGVTIKGVTLTAQATGATFAALERTMGNAWARSVRQAAKKGGTAVLQLLAPSMPAGADKLPLAHQIADAYAAWAATQPEIKADPKKPAAKPKEDGKDGKGEGGGPDKATNLDVGQYGHMVALQTAIGNRIAPLAPVPGRSVALEVKGACSIEEVYLALKIELEASHGEGSFEVGGAATISIGIGDTKENIAINEKLAVKGHGDDAVEAMHMAGLAIEHWMRSQQFDWKNPSIDEVLKTGKKFLVNAAVLGGGGAGIAAAGVLALAGAKIADFLWGKNFERDIVLQMDEDDYGEHSVAVGIGLTGGDGGDTKIGAGFDYEHSTKVKKIGGSVGTETEDKLKGSFAIGFKGGGFKFSLSGHIDVPVDGQTCVAAFKIGMERAKGEASDASVVADILVNNVRGLSQHVAKRAHGVVKQIADGIDTVLRVASVVNAIQNAGGLELSGEYDSASGVLTLSMAVTRTIAEAETNAGVVAIEMSLSVGEEIFSVDIPIDPPPGTAGA